MLTSPLSLFHSLDVRPNKEETFLDPVAPEPVPFSFQKSHKRWKNGDFWKRRFWGEEPDNEML